MTTPTAKKNNQQQQQHKKHRDIPKTAEKLIRLVLPYADFVGPCVP